MKKTINRTTQLLILLTVPLALIFFFSKLILSVFGAGFVAGVILILITLGALLALWLVMLILNVLTIKIYVSRIFFYWISIECSFLNLFCSSMVLKVRQLQLNHEYFL
jgi:hypothetical protein